MSHLPSERLAALIDDPPSSDELAHLAVCPDCAREPAAYALLAGLTKADPGLVLPLTRWESLAPLLQQESLIERNPRGRPVGARRRLWIEAAAAAVLIVGGASAGWYSRGAAASAFHGSELIGTTDSTTGDNQLPFRSTADALEAESRSRAEYQAAISFLAQHDASGRTADSPASMKTRLTALDRVRATMDEALHDAPFDPVINGYILSTIGQQAATRRQLTSPIRFASY